MCGIAGVVSLRGGLHTAPQALQALTERLAHRGPDGSGHFVEGPVYLGHRRLSIIDLEGGHQPFRHPQRRTAITYNGEVYNYRELRRELETKGHAFETNSDTEVVLHAYEEWGKRCVDRLQGMFAFAVADFEKNEVFIARDPFGIKPLVYIWGEGSLSFASEIQALRALPGWTGEVDLRAIDLYLRLQYIPGPLTAFRQVRKLPPGHCMTIRLGDGHVKIERYWAPQTQPNGRPATLEELDAVLRDSVRRHLVADVPFGAFLSGGVDSSLVVAYMAEILDRPVKTFTIGFGDSEVDESGYARLVASEYGTEHREEVVEVDALGVLPELVQHYGEPFGDQSAIPTWYLSKVAASEVPMVLSGDGGDELFAGYPTHARWVNRMRRLGAGPEKGLRGWALQMARGVWPARYPTPSCPSDDADYWLRGVRRFSHAERAALWRPGLRFLADLPDDAVNAALQAQGGVGVDRVQRVDMEVFLPDDILVKVDIASMAFGLEVRPPILDRAVFETAARLPTDCRLAPGGEGPPVGKWPLKRLMADRMGEPFAMRRKQGFVLPLKEWLYERSGEGEVKERLFDPGSPLADWFEPAAVEVVVRSGNAVNVWLLVVLDEWARQQKEQSVDAWF